MHPPLGFLFIRLWLHWAAFTYEVYICSQLLQFFFPFSPHNHFSPSSPSLILLFLIFNYFLCLYSIGPLWPPWPTIQMKATQSHAWKTCLEISKQPMLLLRHRDALWKQTLGPHCWGQHPYNLLNKEKLSRCLHRVFTLMF